MNLKGSAVLLRFRDSFGFKSKDKENRFSLNVFGLTVLYCTTKQILISKCLHLNKVPSMHRSEYINLSF